MSLRCNHFKLGLFVLAGIAVLVLALLAFGARGFLEKKELLETYIDDEVQGLSVGSPVELRGVRVGKVTQITFSWNVYRETRTNFVLVEFEIRDDVSPLPAGEARQEMIDSEIRKGLRARVKGQGITGNCILSLEYVNPANYPPLAVPWKPRRIYVPSAPSQFNQLLASLEKSLRNVEQLDFGKLQKSLEGSLASLEQVLKQTEQVDLEGLSTNATSLLVELRETNVKIKSLLTTTQGTVKGLNLEKLSVTADTLLVELRETVQKLQPGLASLDFNSINDTLANARRAIQTFDDAMRGLKEYPSGFIFGGPPQPAKSVQRPAK
jgi:ABC-type transporter Mla subunit MlaD